MKDNTFTTRKIIKKDFLLVPLYYIFYILIPLLMGHTLIKILSFVGINLTKKRDGYTFFRYNLFNNISRGNNYSFIILFNA